ncbi:DNRLRE domain-containing protein [Lutibacter sp. B2]|nr:DNRLRE domain-containing protein [Lutibacter sp. B2]
MNSTIIQPQVETAQISMQKPNRIFGFCTTMYIGKKHLNDVYRILFNFPILEIPAECIILKAVLRIYVQFAGMYKKSLFTPYALEENWSIDTVKWNNQPPFYPTVSGESKYITRSTFYTFNITDMVSKWYNHEISNYGFIIKNEEIQNQTYKEITTVKNDALSPTIEITYSPKIHIQPQPPVPTRFIEETEDIDTDELYRFSSVMNTSLTKTITCYVENLGDTPVEILLQISPNNIHFCDDCSTSKIIEPHTLTHVVPYTFSKYGRIAVRNVTPGETSRIRIWYQAQE